MTERKRRILETALRLFAENGYNATSTSKVAKDAGVSEGLIFRHFGNKENLLEAILEMARESAYHSYADALSKSDPAELIRSVLRLPLKVNDEERFYWKLIYALRWQTTEYDHSLASPLKMALVEAFKKLGSHQQKAEAEAESILIWIDGMVHSVLLKKTNNLEDIIEVVLRKYEFDSQPVNN